MRYLALAVDYDGTLAKDGRVSRATVHALEQVAASGRRIVLVTGRELPELFELFPEIGLFDRVVAENGALLYRPRGQEIEVLGQGPAEALVTELVRRGVVPLSVGRCVVATVQPHEATVLAAIRDLGLELQVIFNKGAVMVLPPNVNKAYGLLAALGELGLSPHNVVAIGDAENDHALLQLAEYSAAVANAVPALKEVADRTTAKSNGEGVIELIRDLLAHDLAQTPPRVPRRAILLGTRSSGEQVTIAPAGVSMLLAGSSEAGRPALVAGILERLAEMRYQFCVVDPQGHYVDFPDAIVLGSERPPSQPEILTALHKPEANVVIDLVSLPPPERPAFLAGLLPDLMELRATAGRPHWIVVAEAHQVLPADWKPERTIPPGAWTSMLYASARPEAIAPRVLSSVGVAAVTAPAQDSAIRALGRALGRAVRAPAPSSKVSELKVGQALVWCLDRNESLFELQVAPARTASTASAQPVSGG
jgi:phosphoglycolate phosphatase (TIGR01487 family)